MNDEHPVQPFPLGVADPEAGVACIGRYGGGVEALRLSDGATLWLDETALQPLAIGHDRVLVRTDHPHENVLALALFDARNGARLHAANVALPFEVDTFRHDFVLRAATTGTAFVLHWQQMRRYSGGAPPSAAVLREMGAGEVEAGVIRIDRVTGEAHTAPEVSLRAVESIPPAPQTPARIGDTVYTLTPSRALEARDAATNELRWQRQLPAPPNRGPAPLPM